MSLKLIGGVRGDVFAYEQTDIREMLSAKNGIYSNARSALYAITRVEVFKKVWLPAYLCESVCEPFLVAGVEIGFYPVSDSLSCELDVIPLGDRGVHCWKIQIQVLNYNMHK